ncbi:legumain [Chanos chanos]|uniref:Legumain n=1 Tax=Chanos chanos TaxID=29144 RepID=A0A6J2W5K9_CHACN|nr:legumain-like [Chanos chanos]
MDIQDCVANKDVEVAILQKKIQSAKSPEEESRLKQELQDVMTTKEVIRDSVRHIVEKSADSPEQAERVLNSKSGDCMSRMYRDVVEYYKAKCFNWHEPKYQSAIHHMYLFANLCEEKIPVERIKSAIDEVSVGLKKDPVSSEGH